MSLIEFGFDAGTFLRWVKNRCKGEMNDYKYEEFNEKKKIFSYENRTTFLGIFAYLFVLVTDLYLFASLYMTSAFFLMVYGVTFFQWYKRKKKEKIKKN